MPLVLEREQVLDVYRQAGEAGRVVPTLNTENQTCTEAILAAAKQYADETGQPDLPVSIGLTNRYEHRAQTAIYSHTGKWNIGLKLFLADLQVLTADDSPYAALSVMIHLDHIQPLLDAELLRWDMAQFSSIMFDASTKTFDENIAATAEFVKAHAGEIVIEGACDEIVEATSDEVGNFTSPHMAERFIEESGVDWIVPNVGTEHRASAADLEYRDKLARSISAAVGPRLVLHGTSSVGHEQVRNLFSDGIIKVNVWTTLERDSSPALLADMLRHAAKIVGPAEAEALVAQGLLGPEADLSSPPALTHYTTAYRQRLVFSEMKRIAASYYHLWYD